MDEYATKLMNEAININYIDETEYPRIAVMNGKCINIMANLWNTDVYKRQELYHCGFENVNLTYTSDIKEALTGAAYIVSSGGAARKAGMTREDLLKGNAEIAAQFGKDIRQYLSLIHIYPPHFCKM